MNPILFPFTWMPESAGGVLLACFKQVTLLQPARKLVPEPLRRLERTGRLAICLPDENPDGKSDKEAIEDLPNLLRAYHEWADLHWGERSAFHKFAQYRSHGPDDASIAWIRAKIREPEGNIQSHPGGGAAHLLQTARLFLAIAQEYDQQHESLSTDLHTIYDMERNLLQDLAPDRSSSMDFTPAPPLPADIETGRPMPEQRLAAWRRLYTHCLGKGNILTSQSRFFVTSDEEALHLVLGPVETPEVVCRIMGIPPGEEEKQFERSAVHQRIDETLDRAVRGGPLSSDSTIIFSENKTCRENTASLTIYRVEGNPMTAALSGSQSVTQSAEINSADGERSDTMPCSLVGHIH